MVHSQADSTNAEKYIRLPWTRTINYTRNDYGAGIQNWSITQGENGIMYFANNEGLLSFDGSRWELYPHPNNLIIRSVAAGKDNRIYAGTFEDFGFWERDEYGHMHYRSLKELAGDFEFNNQEIWKILVHGDSVWFQSFTVAFLYHNDQLEIFRTDGVMTCFTRAGDQILARITGKGLYSLGKNGFTLLDSSAFFRDNMIRVILPAGKEKLLVATSDMGIYIWSSQGRIEHWNHQASDKMKGRVINRGLISPAGQYVFGTQLYGIFVFDSAGNYLYNISQESGLQNNTVLGLYTDKQGHLWAGLDNGIDLVDLESEISYFRDPAGKIGAVYSVLIHGDRIYAGTNKGLFHSRLQASGTSGILRPDFSLIPGSESQVWSLHNYGNQIFCGHNSGTFEISDTNIHWISNVSGGYDIQPLVFGNDDYLIQCTYTNFVIYRYASGRWVFSHEIPHLNQPIKYIQTDHLGNIWASHNTRGLFRIRLNQTLTEIEHISCYGKQDGFLSDYQIGVFRISHRIIFLNEGRFFTFDDLNDTIIPYDLLNAGINDTTTHKIIPAGEKQYWFISDSHLRLVGIHQNELEKIVSYPFDLFSNRQIRSFEFIRKINDNQSILCLNDGFAILPHHRHSPDTIAEAPFLKQVTAYGGNKQISLNIQPRSDGSGPEIKNKYNSLSFLMSAPFYGSELVYMVRLEGLEEQWHTLTGPIYRYERLPAGDYTLHLAAMDQLGHRTEEFLWPFRVNAPWYWSPGSRALYIFSFFLLLFLIIRYFLRRLSIQEDKLKQEKEAEIIKMRNEQLQSEISYKSKELANTTFNIMKKNQLLLEIREALEKELSSSGSDHQRSFNRLTRLVDRHISHEDDWKVFESNFEKAHEEFLFRIRERYPDLTPGDLKLCAYLRMNLSTKKIALLLGITVRGVENHRYRLRRKLNLGKDTNLIDFMMKF